MLQTYVPPPEAVKTVEVPTLIVASVPALAVGPAPGFTITEVVEVHPLVGSVTVTV